MYSTCSGHVESYKRGTKVKTHLTLLKNYGLTELNRYAFDVVIIIMTILIIYGIKQDIAVADELIIDMAIYKAGCARIRLKTG